MSDRIVQLQDRNDDNIYPVAGAATQGSITKAMLAEGVFEGAEISNPGNIAYVSTSAIQDEAVTTAKIADLNVTTAKLATGAVTSDKIDSTTIDLHDYKTASVTSLGARAKLTVRGGMAFVSVAGDTVSTASSVIYDNLPFTVPYSQEINDSIHNLRVLVSDGTTAGTTKIAVGGDIAFPAQVYLNGAFVIN